MTEILHQLIGRLSHYLQLVGGWIICSSNCIISQNRDEHKNYLKTRQSCINPKGGRLGFLPSSVSLWINSSILLNLHIARLQDLDSRNFLQSLQPVVTVGALPIKVLCNTGDETRIAFTKEKIANQTTSKVENFFETLPTLICLRSKWYGKKTIHQPIEKSQPQPWLGTHHLERLQVHNWHLVGCFNPFEKY